MVLGIAPAVSTAGEAVRPAPPKKIFAHYMGCYPVASASTAYARRTVFKTRHDAVNFESALGSRWRNFFLVPDGMELTPEQSADLEIRRALRAGIDGFAIDVLAGGEKSVFPVLDALFKVAEEKNYPFEITWCLDNPAQNALAIDYLLKHHGTSPKLARRNGKVLFLGYASVRTGMAFGAKQWADRPEFKGKDITALPALRATPEGWKTYIGGFRAFEKQFGVPMYFHFDLTGFYSWMQGKPEKPVTLLDAVSTLAEDFDAVGHFRGGGPEYDAMAKAVRAKGAEWSEPLIYQYENMTWASYTLDKGGNIMRDRWERARENDATLLQFTTWNDYTENTHLAPAADTRYTLFDLNAYYVQWWKTGTPPVPDHDRVYFLYREFPEGARIYPFKPRAQAGNTVLEVLTILPKAATIRLPGRAEPWEAPAGLSFKQFPLTAGPVIAEVVRGGKVAVRLESPEPITDRPYRDQQSLVCYSTEELRHWQADFGDADPAALLHGEYADADKDGLPNWFEMYWFGTFMDWSTATKADPQADPDGDGKTNLEEYLAQTDPTKVQAYAQGAIWSLDAVAKRRMSFHPDSDEVGTDVWYYLTRVQLTPPVPHDGLFQPLEGLGWYPGEAVQRAAHRIPFGTPGYENARLGEINHTWTAEGTGKEKRDRYQCVLTPRRHALIALAWQSPVEGEVALRVTVDPVTSGNDTPDRITLCLAQSAPYRELTRKVFAVGEGGVLEAATVDVRPGERLYIVADCQPDNDYSNLPLSGVTVTLTRLGAAKL